MRTSPTLSVLALSLLGAALFVLTSLPVFANETNTEPYELCNPDYETCADYTSGLPHYAKDPFDLPPKENNGDEDDDDEESDY